MLNKNYSEFIKKIPKTDLHVHLDGSIRIPTLIDLAKSRGITLPSYTEEGLRELVFKDSYNSLVEYLQGFGLTIAVMQDKEALERVAYEFVKDNIEEGVKYVEVRFAPQFHVNDKMSIEDVFEAVSKGMEKAKSEFNSSEKVVNGEEPEFNCGIISCAMRAFGKGFSKYFDQFLDAHRFSKPISVFSLASYELVQAMTHIRDTMGIPIVGFDLAGAEAGFPAHDHQKAYALAHKNFFKKTVHAGEAYGAESIFQAITKCYADRIGHGYYIFTEDMIKDPSIVDKKAYIQQLAEHIADRRITIEVCLTSNMQTNPSIGDIKNHQFKEMLKAKLSTSLCTDNRTVSNTTVSREIQLAVENFDLTKEELKNCIIYGFKRSFYPGTYREKRAFVKKNIDYYEKIEAEFFKDDVTSYRNRE